jgi:type IV pilus assembly protein PilM
VVVGVANQKVVVPPGRPAVDALTELRKSLAFQVQDYIPMPVEQASSTSTRSRSSPARTAAGMLRVLLVAAASDMVDSALLAVQKAGCSRRWST